MLQKTFTVDFLTKKKKVNKGEIPQYYVENSHPAIIDPDVFDMVQFEMKRRKEKGGHHSGASCFSSKLVCGECGNYFGSKVWHSTSKYRRTIWQCNHKFKGSNKCGTPHFDEATLEQLFMHAFNQLITSKDEIIENCEMIKQVLTDSTALDSEAEELQAEITVVTGLIRKCVDENASSVIDQAEYQRRYEGFVVRYEKAKDKLEKIEESRQGRQVKREQLDSFLATLIQQDSILTEFDETLWFAVVDNVTVLSAEDIQFAFRDGTVITTKF